MPRELCRRGGLESVRCLWLCLVQRCRGCVACETCIHCTVVELNRLWKTLQAWETESLTKKREWRRFMRKERQAFNCLWNFVYPSKHCCQQGFFSPFLLFSCLFYFLSIFFFLPNFHVRQIPISIHSTIRIPLLSFWMFYFHFHFFGLPIETHILFTLSLSRYSMFPYCFLCWNSQRKASQLASAPWALLRRQSASKPQRLSLFLHLEALCLPLSGIRRGTGLGLSAFVSFFPVDFKCRFLGISKGCVTWRRKSKLQ